MQGLGFGFEGLVCRAYFLGVAGAVAQNPKPKVKATFLDMEACLCNVSYLEVHGHSEPTYKSTYDLLRDLGGL